MKDLSNEYLVLLANKHYDFVNFVESLMGYLTWRKKLDDKQKGQKIKVVDCHWNLDGNETNIYEGNGDARRAVSFYEFTAPTFDVSRDDFADYASLWEREKVSRPLHHELLEEAERLFWLKHYRSGYLVMYSAIEVASKLLVRVKLPEVEWLKDYDKSPPLLTIYQDYINPDIAVLVNEEEFTTILNMTSKRNKVANSGAVVKGETLYAHKQFVRLLLYKIDCELGYSWATSKEGFLFTDYKVRKIS